MTDQVITFETSELAIKKGFDRWKVQEPIQIPNSISTDCDTHWPPVTQSLLQRWLREKHNLHSTIYSTQDAHNSSRMRWGMNIYPIDGLRFYETGGEETKIKHNPFDTYEEALEESLKLMLYRLPDIESHEP